ncbi:MAG: BhlA/UviB family holin-like peptide [Anaerostipes sp.]|nr:BhlA/UviB family holin-like peptide [Anaerostipes sp.]
MEEQIMKLAMSQGLWAVIAIFLILYIIKAQEKRDLSQSEREKNYQKIIENLLDNAEIFESLNKNLNYVIETLEQNFTNNSH